MKPFVLSPWEYVGAEFDPKPHAETRFEIDGKKRRFLLKMRRGVIYFKEPTLATIYAIPQLFDEELSQNPSALIEAWTREVRDENFGVMVVTHRKWPNTPIHANFCIILRADGRGWIAEHFDLTWQEFDLPASAPIGLWKSPYFELTDSIIKATRAQFLNRAIDPALLETVSTRWTPGPERELVAVVVAAFQLFASPFPEDHREHLGSGNTCVCKSNSPFQSGSVMNRLITIGEDFYRFRRVWDLVKNHYAFIGLEWQKATDNPDLQSQFDPKIWQRGIEEWGENWRGNWIGKGATAELTFPPVSVPSQHEKLEAALTLREFLPKVAAPDKLEIWLREALAN